MTQAGLSEEVAKNYAEMGAGMRSGEIVSEYNLNHQNVFGKTKPEAFAQVFASMYAQT